MKKYMESVELILKELGLNYKKSESGNILEVPFKTKENEKVDILFFIDEKIKYLKVLVPIIATFDFKKPGKLLYIINEYNKKIIYGGLAMREYKNEILFIEYNHGMSLERGRNGQIFKGEVKEIISYINFLHTVIMKEITEEFEELVFHGK
ncbi:hypothetical protein [Bacillus cereus]|uniref:hypothetical protein n=1 Tax=Bacillus cereus TaxID=1396 RepID=UPI003D2F3079